MIEAANAGDSFERDLLEVFKPPAHKGVVDWLTSNVSFMPGPLGRFVPDFQPWILEPLEATFNPEVRQVTNLGCVQAGKSATLALSLAYMIGAEPAEAVLYQTSNPEARDFHRQVIRPILEGIPAVRDQIPQDKAVRWDSISIGRSHIWTRGQDTQNNLNRISARFVFADEVWKWKPGHLRMAARRSLAFGWIGKLIIGSQAGYTGSDLDRHWQTTTQEEWSFACPHCQTVQPFAWEAIRLPDGGVTGDGINENLIMGGTWLECSGCKGRLEDSEETRNRLNASGRYVRRNLAGDPSNRGFHWNALAARPWGELAVEWTRAKLAQTNGDDIPLEIFRLQQLATMVDRSALDSSEEIAPGPFRLRETWAEMAGYDLANRAVVPKYDPEDKEQAPLAFVGVDAQRDGYYAVCRIYAADGRSRLFDWAFFNTPDEVESFRAKCGVIPPFTFVDCGDQMDQVQRIAARFGWNCTRGTRKNDFPWASKDAAGKVKVKSRPYSKPREVEPAKGLLTRVYYFGNLPFKDLLFRLRRSGVHQFPLDAGEDYSKQMTSERRIIANNGQPLWRPPAKRPNHLWDCEVLLMLPALAFGLAGESKATPGQVEEKPAQVEPEAGEVEE